MAAARARFGVEPKGPKPQNDIYVGLLIVSLVAMLIGCALLALDFTSYPDTKPPVVEVPPVKGK